MSSKPSFFDPKYSGLSPEERLRQSERDKLLWEQTEALKEANELKKKAMDDNDYVSYSEPYNQTTGGLNYYKNNVDDFIRDDEIEHKPKSRKQEIKNKYAELRYTQDVLKGRLQSELSMWLVVFHLGLVLLLTIMCNALEKISFTTSALIFGASVILSILFTQVRKSMITNKIQEIDDELADIRTELHQINAKNKKSKEASRKRKIQKAREEFVDDQVNMF